MSRVSQINKAARRRMAAGEAVGPHRVESWRFDRAVDQDRRGQARAVRSPFERGHRFVVCRNDDEPVDAAADQRLDAAALVRRVLTRGANETIITVAVGEPFDSMHEAGEEDVGDVGDVPSR